MMNDTTTRHIAAAKAIVNNGYDILDIRPHLTMLLELAPNLYDKRVSEAPWGRRFYDREHHLPGRVHTAPRRTQLNLQF